jgi:hypothetical protein
MYSGYYKKNHKKFSLLTQYFKSYWMAAFFDTLADIIVHPRENFAAAKQKSRQLSKQISEINVKDTKKYAVAGLKKW